MGMCDLLCKHAVDQEQKNKDQFSTGKNNWHFLTKLNIVSPYNTAITPFGIYSDELKIYIHTKTRIQGFIVVLFLIAEKLASNQDVLQHVSGHIKGGTSYNGILFSNRRK